ncbi:MAG: exo-alpha-sialidase [Clostridia bacterium]|nr:exo-alpha-sialidase [Clostridia bacterium]
MQKGIVYKGDGIFDYCGWPTVARINENTLAVAFSGNRLRHVCPFGRTMICYSYDDGKTWTNPMAVVNTKFDDRDGGVVANGKQVLVSSFNNNYNYQLKSIEWHYNSHGHNEKTENEEVMIKKYIELNKDVNEDDVGSSLTISEDGGKTFPTRIIVPITSPHGPKVLADGSYVWVGHPFRIEKQFCVPGHKYRNFLPEAIYCSFSKDGYEWSDPIRLPSPPEENIRPFEPDVIQLKNGELLVQIRGVIKNTAGLIGMHLYQTVSSENMTKWSTPVYVGVPASPPHLFRHSSGTLISAVTNRNGPYEEQILLSDDEGATWKGPYSIDSEAPDSDIGYPSTVELLDGRLLTVYYHHDKKGEANYLKYTIWSLDELK